MLIDVLIFYTYSILTSLSAWSIDPLQKISAFALSFPYSSVRNWTECFWGSEGHLRNKSKGKKQQFPTLLRIQLALQMLPCQLLWPPAAFHFNSSKLQLSNRANCLMPSPFLLREGSTIFTGAVLKREQNWGITLSTECSLVQQATSPQSKRNSPK